MAGAGEVRQLRRRVRSVQSIKKITKAMELIAASRILRAQARVAAARPYAEQITAVIQNLAAAGGALDHPLLVERDVHRVGFLVIAGDRGLAGGYNAAVIREAERALQAEVARGRDYALILVGKKANDYFRFRRYRIEASFAGFSDDPSYEDARAIADAVRERFEGGQIDQLELVFTRFLSVATQRVAVRRFLPLEAAAISELAEAGPQADYEFEPEPGEILDAIVPRYVEARIFAAMLDAAASEHAARQRAMKSATDNAEELITVLQRKMNRARQDAITNEIMQITSGAEALAAAASGDVDLLRDRIEDPDVFRHFQHTLDRRNHRP
jgi:F-type H+-transporting ATPase subunit gamma